MNYLTKQAAIAAFLYSAACLAGVELGKSKTFYIECDKDITPEQQLQMICKDLQGKNKVGVWACGEIYYMTVDCEKLKK